MTKMIKGRIAEAIAECMFNEMGYKVIRYGYENVMPELAVMSNQLKGKIATKLKHQPDFIVLDPRGYPYFIEVKYRANAEYEFDEDSSYPDAFILLISKDGMWIQDFSKLCDEDSDDGEFVYLTDCKPFKSIKKDIVLKYVKIIRKVFSGL